MQTHPTTLKVGLILCTRRKKLTLCKFALLLNWRSGLAFVFAIQLGINKLIHRTMVVEYFRINWRFIAALTGGRVLNALYWSNDLLSLTQLVLYYADCVLFRRLGFWLCWPRLLTCIWNVIRQSLQVSHSLILKWKYLPRRRNKKWTTRAHNKFTLMRYHWVKWIKRMIQQTASEKKPSAG